MPAMTDQLQQYATALTDPTRGMILMELERAGELTATQLAHRLGLTPNNVYHHMRVLSQLGVVGPPRIVPGPTYVEKYYQVIPELQAALRLDQSWYDSALGSMSAEDRKASLVSMCLTMALLLRRAARDYQEMGTASLDQAMRDDHLFLLSVNRVSREQLKHRLESLRGALEEEYREFAEDLGPRTDLMLIAALPFLRADDSAPAE